MGGTGPGRTFGWEDMWAATEDDPRESGDEVAGEHATLVRYLRDRRLTLGMKCEGLTPQQLAERAVPPSDMSLLGARAAPGRGRAVLVPRGHGR